MGRRRYDVTGQRFGRLQVLKYVGNNRYECICDCGNITYATGPNLRSGATKSCGCLAIEIASNQLRTHGYSKDRLYNVWKGMRQRCYNEHNHAYHNYGGRGIHICEEWYDDYVAFRDWALNNGYRDGLSIDRKNNNGPYAPYNCRWATPVEQGRNTRSNVLIEHDGETHCIEEWAEITGLHPETIRRRIQRGVPEDKLLSPPYWYRNNHEEVG